MRQGWQAHPNVEGLWIGPEVRWPEWARQSALNEGWEHPCVRRVEFGGKASYEPGFLFGPLEAGQTTTISAQSQDKLEDAQLVADAQMAFLAETNSAHEWQLRFYSPFEQRWRSHVRTRARVT